MKLQKLLDEMEVWGYALECGHHVDPLAGYYAFFYASESNRCRLCDRVQLKLWEETGHGLTLREAVEQARDLVLGRDTEVLDSEFYEVE